MIPNHNAGMTRRSMIQAGFSGLLGLSTLNAQAFAKNKADKSIILIFLTGAPSHIDMFDLKPDAPEEIRGSFKPIQTNVTGIQISEHLPKLAQRADKYALIRSMAHKENNHLVATHHTITGHQQPGWLSTYFFSFIMRVERCIRYWLVNLGYIL